MKKEKFMKEFNGEKVFSLEYDKETLKDMVLELQELKGSDKERENKKKDKEIERLHSIIKEVREYIKQEYDDYEEFIYGKEFKNKILEILDKVDKE